MFYQICRLCVAKKTENLQSARLNKDLVDDEIMHS